MAEGGNLPELGGYDYEFTSTVPEDLECLVCHLTMKDPVQIVGCGHRLCNICMESLMRCPSPICPADIQPLSREKIFPDAACHRKILDLTVKCSYSGCSWTGELRAVEEHTAVCRKFPVECTNKCGLKDIPREKLDVHVRDECPATEVQCEYKNLGCDAVFPRSNAKSHSNSQVEKHLNLALRGLESTQLQVIELVSLVKEQSQQIERLNNPPFVWKIPNFQAVYDRAVTGEQEVIFSDPFYLSKFGYKLKIKMRPNGGASNPQLNKKLKGKFLSLCIIVVPGDYDWMLPWPFSEEVLVTLIDQDPRQHLRENISKVINFKKDHVSRPLKEDYVGLGIGSFVSQNVLQTGSYLINNTMFIMVGKNNAQFGQSFFQYILVFFSIHFVYFLTALAVRISLPSIFSVFHILMGMVKTIITAWNAWSRHAGRTSCFSQKAKVIKMAAGGNVPELGGYDYDFTSRIPEDLECLVCQLTMKDPVQIVGCGHRLCNICMESLLRRSSPTCPADRQPLSRDKIFPDAACHRRILDLSVKCSYSGCSWAGELRAMEEHAGVCQKLLVKCPHNCGLRDIPREKLEVHVRDECPAIEVQCEYKNLGCRAVFPRSNVKSHSETQVERHLNLALHGLQTTQLQVNELVSLVKEQQRQIEQLKEKSERLDNPPFVWKIPNFKTVYEKAVTGEQEVIFSEPFYLFRCGYRLKIKMRPNGGASNPQMNKKFKGKYLSLYIIVVPGDYDWMLPWPISEEIRVTLIDQDPLQHLRENISKVIKFGSGSVLRPLKDDDVSGVGIGTFVEQNVLPTRSYLYNDTVFIMVNKSNAQ
ncbi:uncharacterized protein LOC144635612 [Oculina patagonica]